MKRDGDVLLQLSLTAVWLLTTVLLCASGQMDLEPTATLSPDASIAATPLPSSTATPTEDPIQRHLALIVGVPTGVGLAVLGLLLCGVWLVCSTYCDRQKAASEHSAGTHSTNAAKRRTKEKDVSMRNIGSSAVSGSLHYEPEESTTHHEASDPTQFEPEDPTPDDT